MVDRQLLTFLCFAKEIVSKRKATAFAALRVPVCAEQKTGKLRNSLRSDSEAFLSVFCPAQTAAQKRNSVSRAAATSTSTSTSKTGVTNWRCALATNWIPAFASMTYLDIFRLAFIPKTNSTRHQAQQNLKPHPLARVLLVWRGRLLINLRYPSSLDHSRHHP